jgi:hypothetical protein
MPGATALKRMCSFAYSIAKLRVNGFNTALRHHGHRSQSTSNWIDDRRSCDTDDAPASALLKHLLHRSLRHVQETPEVHS